MEIITIDENNIDQEHICCAISDKKCSEGVEAKKSWLKGQFQKGYRFKRLNVRGKVFIEYVPSEAAWLPLDAPDYMVINCFWVSGQFKKKGYGKKLLDACRDDAHNKNGIVVVTGKTKKPFLSDSKFFKKQGFVRVDSADPCFELWCEKNDPDAPDPRFLDTARKGTCTDNGGVTVYYSDACPFTEYWNQVELKKYAEEKGVPLTLIKTSSREQAIKLPVPFPVNAVFYRGKYVTAELKPHKHLDKLIAGQ